MKYCLKDKKLAAHFRAIYPSFDDILNTECSDQYLDSSDHVVFCLARKGSNKDRLFFEKSEIGILYDAKRWNLLSETMPPVGVWMRAETDKGIGLKARIDELGIWFGGDSQIIGFSEIGKIVKFRPWED